MTHHDVTPTFELHRPNKNRRESLSGPSHADQDRTGQFLSLPPALRRERGTGGVHKHGLRGLGQGGVPGGGRIGPTCRSWGALERGGGEEASSSQSGVGTAQVWGPERQGVPVSLSMLEGR